MQKLMVPITDSTWRTKLDVYSKGETDSAISKAKETVAQGDGISVTSSDESNGTKKFTCALDNTYKTKIDEIGSGTVRSNTYKNCYWW